MKIEIAMKGEERFDNLSNISTKSIAYIYYISSSPPPIRESLLQAQLEMMIS